MSLAWQGSLFDAPWKQRRRPMYDRMVLEPRMAAIRGVGTTGSLPRDGVAWHGDSNRKTLHDPLMATVSLGERRRFLLRPGTSGSPTHRFRPGGGDLPVMGGATQQWVGECTSRGWADS